MSSLPETHYAPDAFTFPTNRTADPESTSTLNGASDIQVNRKILAKEKLSKCSAIIDKQKKIIAVLRSRINRLIKTVERKNP